MRGPAFLMSAAAAALASIAASTHGFAVTRSLLDALADVESGANQNRLVANLFPIAFALAAGMMLAIGRVSLSGHSWRYRSFLLLKTLSLATILSLLWIEGGAALRASITNQSLRALAGGLAGLPAASDDAGEDRVLGERFRACHDGMDLRSGPRIAVHM